jgi:MFS family permease
VTQDKKVQAQSKNDAEAMDRLRDRTDELELIISSLTIFALLSMPGWLYNKIASVYTHLSVSNVIVANVGASLIAGVSYGLAACFIVHLMARAYWVGLIGLRAAFPDGINWSKTPGLGPIGRKYYRATLPDLGAVISKTDRLASSLFAVISMLTLQVLWFGGILIGTLVLSGAIGARFGFTNAGIGIGSLVLLVIFLGAPLVLYILDAQLAGRIPRLRENRFYLRLVRFLRWTSGLAYPQRLVLPVQLTLQSNTRPFAVFAAITLSIVAIVIIGTTSSAAWRSFTLSGQFSYMDNNQVREGFRSTYYENMQSSVDRLRGWPRVDSFNQSGSFVSLFLPYQPLRDNLLLDKYCSKKDEAAERVDCIRKLWSLSIDGKPVSLSGFDTAERGDLGMRGLIGLVPMTGLEPGLRKIEVVWNPSAAEDAAPVDDRYLEASVTYVIPIAFAPEYELSL